MGHVDPDGRRADHGARRRRRAAGPLALRDDLRGRWACAPLDDRVDQGFGRRAVDWELKGVPLRIEVGPRDLADGNVTLVDRLRGGKQAVAIGHVPRARTTTDARSAAERLLGEACPPRGSHRRRVGAWRRPSRLPSGWARVPWDTPAGVDGETRLRALGLTVRCLQRPTARCRTARTRPTSSPTGPGLLTSSLCAAREADRHAGESWRVDSQGPKSSLTKAWAVAHAFVYARRCP